MMMQDALPGIKRFLAAVILRDHVRWFLIRLVAAFIVHVGRMSATQAAGAIRTQARHRAAVIRFLAKLGWSDDWSVLAQLAQMVLQAEQRRGGTGLGLSIVKHLVQSMHGAVRATSRPGQGTTFSVQLPRAPAENYFVGKT